MRERISFACLQKTSWWSSHTNWSIQLHTYASIWNCIEPTFEMYKKRFPILTDITPYLMFKQVRIPLPCVVLHNFFHIVNRSNDFFRDIYKNAVVVQDINPESPHKRRSGRGWWWHTWRWIGWESKGPLRHGWFKGSNSTGNEFKIWAKALL